MKFLKTVFLIFLSLEVIGLNIDTARSVQIANASNFSNAYEFRLQLDEMVPFLSLIHI